ncbi:hypothetical protein AV530_016080 [Patagioenas fasciata monilis]|uniref:Uncharacterized protein n=1 Tax=Patagioenas fasciata monilis TaxID=372326 RepID=A0A1V4KJZ4_PATFA|nr:hypothetical protein AV530_016080 [Patagioenas fasciata monilis]
MAMLHQLHSSFLHDGCWGDAQKTLLSLVQAPTDSLWNKLWPWGKAPKHLQMLGMYHIFLIQRVFSILGFREDDVFSCTLLSSFRSPCQPERGMCGTETERDADSLSFTDRGWDFSAEGHLSICPSILQLSQALRGSSGVRCFEDTSEKKRIPGPS